MMFATEDNGLAQYMALANLTAVGAGILVFVVLAIWVVTKGIPALIDRWDNAQQRSEKAHAESRREFLDALQGQQTARSEAAKAGHDAAFRIADNLYDLTNELRTLHGVPQSNGRKASL